MINTKHQPKVNVELLDLSQINLGYACQNMSMPDVTAAHRVTAKTLLSSNLRRNEQLARLREVLKINLESLQRILQFNLKHDIKLYRIPSELVPLATHPITDGWNYIEEFTEEFKQIGAYIKKYNLRTTVHSTQYTFLNSPKAEVRQQAVQEINYHTQVLDTLGLDNSHVVVLHVGGIYGNKTEAIQRFVQNFIQLSEQAKKRLVIENDDKSFGIKDILKIVQQIKVPALLDYHHLRCKNDGEVLEDVIFDVLKSWGERRMKMHFSSPKSVKQYRNHSEYIDSIDFCHFINKLGQCGIRNLDIMLECKGKDVALLKLRRQIQEIKKKSVFFA